MKRLITITAASTMALLSVPAHAQSTNGQQPTTQERIGNILGALLGNRAETPATIDSQWAAGQMPLTTGRADFETKADSAVNTGTISKLTADRMKFDYAALVELEKTYAADRRFTVAERNDLGQRYSTFQQVVNAGAYADGGVLAKATLSDGRAEFDRRVNASVSARRISRTQGTQLKTDYVRLVQVEAGYLNDSVLTAAERTDLDTRLDALDQRVGDVRYGAAALTPQARLDAVAAALATSGLTTMVQAQIRVEQADLSRLAAAFARMTPSADDQAYLERRIIDLETRSRIRR